MANARRSKRRGPLATQPAETELIDLLSISALDNLEEITTWLGTFRARLEIARGADQVAVEEVVGRLEARYRIRRAELA